MAMADAPFVGRNVEEDTKGEARSPWPMFSRMATREPKGRCGSGKVVKTGAREKGLAGSIAVLDRCAMA